MAEHVEDHAAAVFLAIVPGRALSRNVVAFKYPIAELAANRKDFAEKADFAQCLQLSAGPAARACPERRHVLTPAFFASRYRSSAVSKSIGDRLFAVDVLPGGYRFLHRRRRGGQLFARRSKWSKSESASAASRSVVQGSPPHSFEIASSFAAFRPTSSTFGMIVSLSLSLTPPCCHDGEIETGAGADSVPCGQ